MKTTQLIAATSLALLSSWTNAGIIIDSINVKMASSTHTVRGATDPDDGFADALNAFESGSRYCDQDLQALTGITSQATCGGSGRDYGALYTIEGRNQGVTEFEFALDWGRGGFIFSQAADDTSLAMDVSDIWWNRNWSSGDVWSIMLEEQGRFSLTLLGFEGCCDGVNSARYRNFDLESSLALRSGDEEFSDNPPLDGLVQAPRQILADGWQALEVNAAVPLPGSLPLLALGTLLMLRRRNRSHAAI